MIAVDRFKVAPQALESDQGQPLAESMPTFFQGELVRRLRESGLFGSVIDLGEGPPPAGPERPLRLEGTITSLSGGSRALRFWIGFGAGRSKARWRRGSSIPGPDKS